MSEGQGPARATNFAERQQTLAGWPVRITTYTIGTTTHCHVDNVSPGAIIARASGPDLESAERAALQKATERLAQTRKRSVSTKG
jgi:hypothetical protein